MKKQSVFNGLMVCVLVMAMLPAGSPLAARAAPIRAAEPLAIVKGEAVSYPNYTSVNTARAPQAVASLSLSPSSPAVQAGDVFTLDIVFDTGGTEVDTVDAYLDFDPAILKVVNAAGASVSKIEPNTTALPNVNYNSVNTTTGQIGFSAYNADLLNGTFTAATIRFRAQAAASASDVIFVRDGGRVSDLLYYGESLNPALENASVTVSPTVTIVTHPGPFNTGQWYNFGGIGGGVSFTVTGNIEAITLTARYGFPTSSKSGLPRRYDIERQGGSSYEVQVQFSYTDDDLAAAGIPQASEGNLHAYHYSGGGNWEEHSTVDTVNNTVTASPNTLEGVWGLGVPPSNMPTVATLQDLSASAHGESNGRLSFAALLALIGLGLGAVQLTRRVKAKAQP